ncbi:MAG: ATP-binding protein [Myxococcota bacterium]|nr:ATP-binding protein [Myxococcota bacterium]
MTEQPIRPSRAAAWLPALSLRNKLLLFAALLVLVPGMLLILIAERSGRDSLERVIGRQLAREAGHTAERLSVLIRTEREALANFANQDLMREIRVADIDKRVSMALVTLRDGSPIRLDYLVVDVEERVVASTDPARLGPLSAGLLEEWMAPADPSRVLGPVRPPTGGGAQVVMTTPVPDPDVPHRSLGTLVGFFDWEGLTAVTASVQRDLASREIAADVLVSGGTGTIIGGSRSGRSGVESPDVSAIARETPPNEPDYVVDLDAGLIIGRASLDPDLPPWKLLVVEPREHALAPAGRLARRLLLLMGLAVAAALALATLSARRVVRPLTELTHAIRSVSRGEASPLRVPVRTEDEVGTLAVAFNDMASELDETQRELVEAEKFAFVGELAAGIAHEIRTSLGVLGSSAQMLQRSLDEKDVEAVEMAQMIRAEVGRLGGVVDDLLTLNRDRPLELESGPVSRPVFRAVDFVAPQACERGIRLEREDAEAEPAVLCDPELVQQVAVNLIVNALQALGSGGRITVRILDLEDGQGGFEVRDDGPGIPEDLRERIFQPFVTAREGGVGLGLTFVKRVVHDHRGSVAVDSTPGAGTRIRIRLPRARERT